MAKKNNIQPARGIRKRCKTISKFVMHEERSQWIKDTFDIGLALLFVVIQLFLIPIGIYIRESEFISSGWGYTGGYLLLVIVLPVLMTLPRYLICRLKGESFEPSSKTVSHLLAHVSLVLLVASWYYHFQFPFWIIAGMLTYAFFNVQVWIVDPLLKLLLNRIQKRAIKFHPLEKATHLVAILSDKFYRASSKGRLGNMKWRKKQATYLDMLILIFEKYAHMPFQIESGEMKSSFIKRCHQITNHWRAQQMKIYFPVQNTVQELSQDFNQSFVAIMNGNLGELQTVEHFKLPTRGIRVLIKKVLPSVIVLGIWFVIYFLLQDKIDKDVAVTVWFVLGTMPATAIVQYFDPDLDRKFDILNNFRTISKTFDKE